VTSSAPRSARPLALSILISSEAPIYQPCSDFHALPAQYAATLSAYSTDLSSFLSGFQTVKAVPVAPEDQMSSLVTI
jgi:hypothetical protein